MAALHGLLARYDNTLMRPPTAPADTAADTAAITARLASAPGPALLDWCHEPAQPWGLATLDGRGATALAEALALQLDGSLRLLACRNTTARLALRLGVKRDDLAQALGRPAHRSDCWDSGWLHDTPTGLARLPQWQPRRATLLLAAAPAPGQSPPALNRGHWPRLVRLLWVRETDAPLTWQPQR